MLKHFLEHGKKLFKCLMIILEFYPKLNTKQKNEEGKNSETKALKNTNSTWTSESR